MGPRSFVPKEIDGLLVSQGKASMLPLTILLLVNRSGLSLPRNSGSCQTSHTALLVGRHGTLILGKSPIKWRQRPDITEVIDWDVKHQFYVTQVYLALKLIGQVYPRFCFKPSFVEICLNSSSDFCRV